MGTRSLESFFAPRNIAVIGASETEGSLGRVILENLMQSSFAGNIYPLNIRRQPTILGLEAYSRISQLPDDIDLAVICTPAEGIARILIKLAACNIPAAMILTGGSARVRANRFRPNVSTIKDVVKKTGIRVMGPDCIGLLVPDVNLNASYLPSAVKSGEIAYIGQSGALANAIVDWAKARSIGLSHVLTLGQGQDVTIADVIDYLAPQKQVKTILIQLDAIGDGPRLSRALSAASKNKLVIGIKSNRFSHSPFNNEQDTKGIASKDMLVDEMFSRSGVLRVSGVKELFDCVDILQQRKSVRGERLAIITNSQGGAILAVDRLLHDRGQLAELSATTCRKLKQMLPEYATACNPVILNPELTPEMLKQVSDLVLADKQVDAVLVVYTPGVGADAVANAQALVEASNASVKTVISCWMGEYSVMVARDLFDAEHLPTYDTPDQAVKAFMYMVQHARTQELLHETPLEQQVKGNKLDKELTRALNKSANLKPPQAWQLLQAYGLQTVESKFKRKPENLLLSADQIEKPWVLKIHHEKYLAPFAYGGNAKQRWRGAIIGINGLDQLQAKIKLLARDQAQAFVDSRVVGYSLQQQLVTSKNLQYSFGIGSDELLGSFVFFGGGGSVADILGDRKVAMLPINNVLAKRLVESSRFSAVLAERSENYDRDLRHLCQQLLALSQMSLDHPQIVGLEANAIIDSVGNCQVLGVAAKSGKPMFTAITPYPIQYSQNISSVSGKHYQLRAIKAEDEPSLDRFYQSMSAQSLRFRFFNARRRFQHNELARFAQIDYHREMAFVAFDSRQELVGLVCGWLDADGLIAEFSVIASDHLKGERMGYLLMTKLIDYLRDERKVLQLHGSVLLENKPMLKLAKRLGFVEVVSREASVVDIVLPLNDPREDWQKRRMYNLAGK